MPDDADAEDEPAVYHYYLDFQGAGSLWGTGRHHMRVVEGGLYRRDKRTTSNTISQTIRVQELDPETGEVEYSISEANAPSRSASGVAEGMGQIRAKGETPDAHLATEDIPEGVTAHNRGSGWPTRPMDAEDIPEDDRGELVTDGGERGLHEKYTVLKDGEEQDGVFVLKPGSDPAARKALAAYANHTENDALARDLSEWLHDLPRLDTPATYPDAYVSVEVMNLARHLYAESRDLSDHVRDSKQGHGNDLAAAIYQARGDALLDAARHLREFSEWLDGDRDRPPALSHGEELAGDGERVPSGQPEPGDVSES